jgi:hypothetical protein
MKTDLKNLKGNVESFSERVNQIRDKDGRFIPLFRRGIPSFICYYLDEHNKLIKSVEQRGGGGEWVESSLTSIYNEDGKIIETYTGEKDLFYSKTINEYNHYGQLIERTEYYELGEIYRKTSREYQNKTSSKLSTLTISMKDNKGELKIVDVRKFPSNTDNNQPKRNIETPTEKESIIIKEEYEYDEVGNWVKKRPSSQPLLYLLK